MVCYNVASSWRKNEHFRCPHPHPWRFRLTTVHSEFHCSILMISLLTHMLTRFLIVIFHIKIMSEYIIKLSKVKQRCMSKLSASFINTFDVCNYLLITEECFESSVPKLIRSVKIVLTGINGWMVHPLRLWIYISLVTSFVYTFYTIHGQSDFTVYVKLCLRHVMQM